MTWILQMTRKLVCKLPLLTTSLFCSRNLFCFFSDDDPYYHGMSAHVPKFAASRTTTLVRSNPPIVRKALCKKFWPLSTKSKDNSKRSQAERNARNSYTLDYRHSSSNRTGLGTSNFYNSDTAILTPINDNDVIYGVNPTMMRTNAQFCFRNVASPSLKTIFFRKPNKDFNNNSVVH